MNVSRLLVDAILALVIPLKMRRAKVQLLLKFDFEIIYNSFYNCLCCTNPRSRLSNGCESKLDFWPLTKVFYKAWIFL
jgi:hypothetical protein